MCQICDYLEKKYFDSVDVKEGDLRIWWIPQIPMDALYFPVKSITEAKHMLELLADYDLFQFYHNIKPDYSNVGGLEVFEGKEWLEWENKDGDTIDDVDEKRKYLVED